MIGSSNSQRATFFDFYEVKVKINPGKQFNIHDYLASNYAP
jgi:hypothetical protein